jgi:hypothetical protein
VVLASFPEKSTLVIPTQSQKALPPMEVKDGDR